MRILCVCLGNICRSPLAMGVLDRAAKKAGVQIEVDSAGTSDWHIGKPPDARGVAAAAARGIDISRQRGRQVTAADFDKFDLILAMDTKNLAHLQRMCPIDAMHRLRLFDPAGPIPDPYYGGPRGFEKVLDQIERAAGVLIENHVQGGVNAN